MQIAPAIILIIVLPFLKLNKTFYKRLVIYIVVGLVVYYIFYLIGSGFGQGSMGKYILALFVIGILIYYLREYIKPHVWFFALFMVLLGLSTHIILPIRAAVDPFINEGDPSTFQRFMDYVFRKQYGPTSFFVRRAPILMQLDYHFLRYFSWQFFDAGVIANFLNISKQFVHAIFQFIVLSLGLTGAYYQFRKSKRSFIYLAALFLMASIGMILVMNLSSTEVRDRPYFFITAYMLWVFWMGIGAMGIVRFLRKKSKIVAFIALCILALLPVINMASHFHKNDRSQELLSLEYGMNFLNGLDKNAIIFTNGDNDTFPLWYAQAVYDPNAEEYYLEEDTLLFKEIKGFSVSERKDIPKKTQQLLQQGYLAKKNLKGIRKDISVANLSLLNTPWYIKQLRDFEGIEINLNDKQIDGLHPIQLSNEANFSVDGIRITYPEGKQLFVKDQMVLQIIKDNYGKRPIYFAVTVADRVGFDEYLQSEGMADRLVSSKGKYQINAPRLNHNIENVFDYCSIYNEDLYKDENMKRLINNYGADFMRMSTTFYQNNDYENAIKYLKKALYFVHESERYVPSLANLYYEMGQYDSALVLIEPLIEKKPNDAQLIYLKVEFLKEKGDIDTALTTIEDFLLEDAGEQYFLNRYVNMIQSNTKYLERGQGFFEELERRYPKNQSIQQYKSQLDKLTEKD